MKRSNTLMTVTAGLLIVLTSALIAGEINTGAVSGRVYDVANRQPVPGAWVAVTENNRGARTDADGRFQIDLLPPGTYNVAVTFADYVMEGGRSTLTVQVTAGNVSTLEIGLVRIQKESKVSGQGVELGKRIVEMSSSERAFLTEVPRARRDKDEKESGRSDDAGATIGLSSQQRPSQSCAPTSDAYKSLPYTGGVLRSEDRFPPQDMFFRDYGTNGFVETRRDRFSTFAVDVDDASYTLVRRYLREGNVPPQDAVRVEEFINHFDYGYKSPTDSKFQVFSELTDSPFDNNVSILKIGVKGREAAPDRRKPINLTLVVDVSGSMGYDNRMELVKQSLGLLVDKLDHNDMVGIVSYNTSARVLLNPVAGNDRTDIAGAIEHLYPGGSTNAEAGLTMGYQIADRQFVYGHNNVVILCSDGVANVGETGSDGIMSRIRRLVDQGITLSTFGFGMGNYNDVLLEQLAQSGNGRYAYVNDLDEARRVFVDNFIANTQVLARDVKVQVEFDPRSVSSYRLVGYENRAVADHRFRDDNQDGGEVGAGHEVTAIYELVLTGQHQCDKLATIFVRSKDADQIDVVEHSYDVLKGSDYQAFDRSRPELRLAIAATRFAELLKGTVNGDPGHYDDLYRIAERVSRELPSEQTLELTELIRTAAAMTSPHTYRYDGDDGYVNYKR
jgi:Ca-activated chloride channel family protein